MSTESFVSLELARSYEALLGMTELEDQIEHIAAEIAEALGNGHTVFWCGNGGSAAEAQHLSAELVGKQHFNRPPLRSIALTTDTSALTAIGNDYGYNQIFTRQLTALSQPGDILVMLSTSGTSDNMLAVARQAKPLGVTTIAMTGGKRALSELADFALCMPGHGVAQVQEMTLIAGHIITGLVEQNLFKKADHVSH